MSQVKQITPVGVVPKAWVKSTLESVSEFITKGSTPTTFGFDWVESGIPFLRSECVTDNGFNMKGLSYISNEAHEYMVRSKIVAGDILISITGNVGRIAIFPKELVEGNINQHIARVRINEPNECDEGFVYYQINQVLYRQYYYGIVTGAAYPQLSLKQIRETPIYLPPLPTQKRIASILSAYDDLIENNLKRIKLLEEIAKRTYEEWFVKFRVNGEQLQMDEVTGLPVGWEKKKLTSVVDITYGYPFKGNEFNQDRRGTPIIRIRNIPNSDTQDFTTEVADDKYLIRQGDLLVGMDGEFYINNWHGEDAYLVQRSCKISAKNKFYEAFIGQAIVKPIKFYEATISGATVAHLGKKHLDEIEIIVPDISKQQELQFLNDLLTQKINLGIQNRKLRESRDILLPRLMNGTINVESK
jgi:type I restriction enzyme S subunit